MLNTFIASFVIGFTGAASPGPLLVVAISETMAAGIIAPLLLITGHSFLELGATVGLDAGVSALAQDPAFRSGFFVVGGVVMLLLACLTVRDAFRKGGSPKARKATAGSGPRAWARLLGLGVVVSVMNPYWTLWWLTIGTGQIAKAQVAGPGHVAAFFGGHILSDYVWYVAVGAMVVFGRNLLKGRAYRWMMAGLGVALGVFGLLYILAGLA